MNKFICAFTVVKEVMSDTLVSDRQNVIYYKEKFNLKPIFKYYACRFSFFIQTEILRTI